jgi:hypothetical protein
MIGNLDWSKLKGPLIDAGLTVLGTAVGGPVGAIAATVGRDVARQLGVGTPAEVEAALAQPEKVEVLRSFEAAHHDRLVALAEAQHELAMAETKGDRFQSHWRPAMSWLLILMWLWNAILLPVGNVFAPTPAAAIPYEHLVAFSGLWLAIYGGGHTIKSVFGRG